MLYRTNVYNVCKLWMVLFFMMCTHIIYLQYSGPQKMKAWAYTLLVWCTVGQDHIQVDSGYWWQLKVSAIQSLGFYFLCFDTMGITELFLRAWPEEVQLEYSLFNQEIHLWPLHFILWLILGAWAPGWKPLLTECVPDTDKVLNWMNSKWWFGYFFHTNYVHS